MLQVVTAAFTLSIICCNVSFNLYVTTVEDVFLFYIMHLNSLVFNCFLFSFVHDEFSSILPFLKWSPLLHQSHALCSKLCFILVSVGIL